MITSTRSTKMGESTLKATNTQLCHFRPTSSLLVFYRPPPAPTHPTTGSPAKTPGPASHRLFLPPPKPAASPGEAARPRNSPTRSGWITQIRSSRLPAQDRSRRRCVIFSCSIRRWIRSKMGNSKSKASENPQVKKIVDKVWDRFASTSEHGALGVQDLYCAILLVYNDINKKLPGPFNDPPSKEEVEELLKTFDRNNDGMLDRNEFTAFIGKFSKNVSARVSTNILLFSFVIPTIVTLARPGAETLPLLGPAVKKAPTPLYSAIMTTLIVFAGSQFRKT